MPSQPDLTVRNYNIRQSNGFNAQLKPTVTYTITYNVGDYGPFTITYEGAQPSPTAIKDAIDSQVRHIRETLDLLG
jgi:hypothetical protein